jgi:hypothetical protein
MPYSGADNLDRIYWYSPVCNDNGSISGWQNTLWDGFSVNEKSHLATSTTRFPDRLRSLILLPRKGIYPRHADLPPRPVELGP